jgi:hypothetical protein
MQKQVDCKNVLKNTNKLTYLLIFFGVVFFINFILAITSLAEPNPSRNDYDVIAIRSLFQFCFLWISAYGLLKTRKWSIRFFYIIAIWYFLFYLGVWTVFASLLNGTKLGIGGLIIYYLIGLMGVYLYRNKECFNKNEKIQSEATK